MRLSEAIMLGATTCQPKAGDMNVCVYGMALNANGVPLAALNYQWDRYLEAARLWPWVYQSRPMPLIPFTALASTVWSMFDNEVCAGKLTLEQLADYVRSIEPDCDCNRFNCDCAKKPVEAEVLQAVEA